MESGKKRRREGVNRLIDKVAGWVVFGVSGYRMMGNVAGSDVKKKWPLDRVVRNGFFLVGSGVVVLFVLASCDYELDIGGKEGREVEDLKGTEDLYDVFAVSEKEAWAVGYYGSIFFTEDGGVSWEKKESGTEESLYGICFVDGQQGWISGASGTVLATQDGGNSWSRQQGETERHLFDVRFVNRLQGMCVGNYGTIVRTHDGGRGWEDISLGVDVSLNALDFVDSSTGWVVGEFGTILRTDDFGSTWATQQGPVEEASLYGVDFESKSTGYVTGIDGIILRSEDGGRTWKREASQVEDGILSVQTTKGDAWAVGLRGVALYRNALEEKWKPIADVAEVWAWLRSVHFAGPHCGWIAGKDGTIFRTIDGRRWERMIIKGMEKVSMPAKSLD